MNDICKMCGEKILIVPAELLSPPRDYGLIVRDFFCETCFQKIIAFIEKKKDPELSDVLERFKLFKRVFRSLQHEVTVIRHRIPDIFKEKGIKLSENEEIKIAIVINHLTDQFRKAQKEIATYD